MNTKHSWWAWAVKSAVVMICWVVLAVYFDRWWISLFSILFLTGIETKTQPGAHFICDRCGNYSPTGKDHSEAFKKAHEAGWIRVKNGDKWEDYCPECQRKHNIR